MDYYAQREKIVTSAAFIKLFEKWRKRSRFPKRTHCKNGHEICAANAHVGDLRHGRYRCAPCCQAHNRAYDKTPKMQAYYRAYDKTPKMQAYYRARNKTPKRRAYNRARNHKRNARIRGNGGTWTAAEFSALCAKYNHRCLCCGKRRKMTPDHVVPVVKGGRNVIENLQPLCLSCNSSKGARTIDYRNNPHPACIAL